jgi:hypothetical protein
MALTLPGRPARARRSEANPAQAARLPPHQERFDPRGDYVRRYVPELRPVPD